MAMAKSKHVVLALAVAVGIWVSRLSCDFVAPPRLHTSSTNMRAETGHRMHRAEASSSKPEAVFGTLAVAVVFTGIATRARLGRKHQITALKAEGEAEAKAESADAKPDTEESLGHAGA